MNDLENLKSIRKKQLKNNTWKELLKTDWRVIKHRDQLDKGITPDMTDEEYQQLLDHRQSIRDWCDNQCEAIENATTHEEVMNVDIIYRG